jgi:hypothetical protein
MSIKPHNFWYAVNNTEILVMPRQHLETFGSTNLKYRLITELMDTVDHIRVREGSIQSHRPQIITPSYYENEILEGGFGEEAKAYLDWLKLHAEDLRILQYGFKVHKQDINEHIVTGKVQEIIARVKEEVEKANDPLTGIIYGVDELWDVCLLKFMVDVIRFSAPSNFNELGRQNLLENSGGVPKAVRKQIEEEFLKASRDSSRIQALGTMLRRYGLFGEYEDRFFALLKH